MKAAIAEQLRQLTGVETLDSAKYLEPVSTARSLGIEAFDRALPDGGLPRGQVTEISSPTGIGMTTSVGLWACRAAQQEARHQGSDTWCAFIDASNSLFAPGVCAAGVDPSRLLVVRPETSHPAELSRIAIRLAESKLFSVLVLDLQSLEPINGTGTPGRWRKWPSVVRRLAMAIEGSGTQILLLTNRVTQRALPLPVALRLQLRCAAVAPNSKTLAITVTKDRRGRVGTTQIVRLPTREEAQPITSNKPEVQDLRPTGRDASVTDLPPVEGITHSVPLSA